MPTKTKLTGPQFGRSVDLVHTQTERVAAALEPFVLLTVRVVIGYALVRAGLGKLANPEGVAAFFAQLGIPAPALNAAVVSNLELFGGGLLMLGLLARASGRAITGVMGVALLTAHMTELAQVISDPGAAVAAAPVPFLIAVLWLCLRGPGSLSLDHLVTTAATRGLPRGTDAPNT
ncbi:DoxX family protein [Haliangium sp.]|uniref:DoxX family protein n=1 Tax=Haliangium sp. TaxID=2663208 RepID=UPI003D0D1973